MDKYKKERAEDKKTIETPDTVIGAPATSTTQAETSEAINLTLGIPQFVKSLKLKYAFGITEDQVVDRLTSLTPDELQKKKGYLTYWQSLNHELDVTTELETGQLVFDTLSKETPEGNRGKGWEIYREIAHQNGALLMDKDRYASFKNHPINPVILDKNTNSWIHETPIERTNPDHFDKHYYGRNGEIDDYGFIACHESDITGCRVTVLI